jgi:hypothetical protein
VDGKIVKAELLTGPKRFVTLGIWDRRRVPLRNGAFHGYEDSESLRIPVHFLFGKITNPTFLGPRARIQKGEN